MSDQYLNFSKEVACTIGLEEAVLLEYLKIQKAHNKVLTLQNIHSDLTFFSQEKLQDILSRLTKTGLISESLNNGIKSFTVQEVQKKAELVQEKWLPDREILDQIVEYGIGEDFALMHVDDFLMHTQEQAFKETSWGIKFLRFVIKKWRFKEIEDNKKRKTVPIHKGWIPDEDALEILVNSGIDPEFIKNVIPEFILYWYERKEESNAWNSKFIAHVRRQWARSNNLDEKEDTPSKITHEWTPNEDFYSVLELTDIPRHFANDALPQFILYWKETGQSINSWNSKFLQHVKYLWEKESKGESKKIASQIDKRIESSWKIQNEESKKISLKVDTRSNQEKFKKLKEKHQI